MMPAPAPDPRERLRLWLDAHPLDPIVQAVRRLFDLGMIDADFVDGCNKPLLRLRRKEEEEAT